VLLDAGGDGEDVRIEDDVFGIEAEAARAATRRLRAQISRRALQRVGLPSSSKAITTTAAP
jgi:hypothetical protein